MLEQHVAVGGVRFVLVRIELNKEDLRINAYIRCYFEQQCTRLRCLLFSLLCIEIHRCRSSYFILIERPGPGRGLFAVSRSESAQCLV